MSMNFSVPSAFGLCVRAFPDQSNSQSRSAPAPGAGRNELASQGAVGGLVRKEEEVGRPAVAEAFGLPSSEGSAQRRTWKDAKKDRRKFSYHARTSP